MSPARLRRVELDDQLVAGAVHVVGQRRGDGLVDGRELLDLLFTEGTQGTEWIDDLRHGTPFLRLGSLPLRLPAINWSQHARPTRPQAVATGWPSLGADASGAVAGGANVRFGPWVGSKVRRRQRDRRDDVLPLAAGPVSTANSSLPLRPRTTAPSTGDPAVDRRRQPAGRVDRRRFLQGAAPLPRQWVRSSWPASSGATRQAGPSHGGHFRRRTGRHRGLSARVDGSEFIFDGTPATSFGAGPG